jgi:multicomponent Na+:H+ antiporter subunit F
MIAFAAAAGVCVALILSLVRLFAGPTLYDRALAANAIVIKAALICAAAAVVANRGQWLDVAFAFVFAAIVVNVATLKVFRARTFQAPLAREAEDL